MTKVIEKYIQFAIDNGLYWRPKSYNWYYELKFHYTNYWEVALMDTVIVLMHKKTQEKIMNILNIIQVDFININDNE